MTLGLSTPTLVTALAAVVFLHPLESIAQPDAASREVVGIADGKSAPSIHALLPIDATNMLFLNKRGQIGLAKFSPGLSLIDWDYYSEVKLDALPALAPGPGNSIVFASPTEVTQAFDTDGDSELDFFQAIVRDWPGKDDGVIVTAGPATDPHGRLLFALSPHAPAEPTDAENASSEEGNESEEVEGEQTAPPAAEPVAPRARIVAWTPDTTELVTVTESTLPIADFAVSRTGLLAARLSMPDYPGGTYISLTDLPAPTEAEGLANVPFCLPSLLIPSDLTKGAQPTRLSFFREDGSDKLLVACPAARQILEIVPERVESTWQGSLVLRALTETSIEAMAETKAGALVAGGDEGFASLRAGEEEPFRVTSVSVGELGLSLSFPLPVDRATASQPQSYSVRAIPLGPGNEKAITVQPVVVSDGRTVILRTSAIPANSFLRIQCQNVTSESGASLLSSAAFYTVQKMPTAQSTTP